MKMYRIPQYKEINKGDHHKKNNRTEIYINKKMRRKIEIADNSKLRTSYMNASANLKSKHIHRIMVITYVHFLCVCVCVCTCRRGSQNVKGYSCIHNYWCVYVLGKMPMCLINTIE